MNTRGTSNNSSEDEYVEMACTLAGATGRATREFRPIIGSNSDDPWTTRTHLLVASPGKLSKEASQKLGLDLPREGYRFIGTQILTLPGFSDVAFSKMITRGLNEKGLAYTWGMVSPKSEPTYREAFGIPYPQFGTLLLTQAATVEEAIDLFDRFPRAVHGNFLLADASGTLALVEISTHTFHVETLTDDGVIGRSNHWISETMAEIGNAFDENASTKIRWRRAEQLLHEGQSKIDVHSLRKVLSDHEGRETFGHSICQHGVEGNGELRGGGSVSSEIIEPTRLLFWYAYGWPCGETPHSPERQLYQDRSWGVYLPFSLSDLEDGEYVTIDGRLTPLAIKMQSAMSR
ncbi:MAG: hypothetical protein HY731_07495 [Candidatus Tectomicrobia bacterium]|nr:hypothetical protein [Candidatus Tectomicrobia bacterium]